MVLFVDQCRFTWDLVHSVLCLCVFVPSILLITSHQQQHHHSTLSVVCLELLWLSSSRSVVSPISVWLKIRLVDIDLMASSITIMWLSQQQFSLHCVVHCLTACYMWHTQVCPCISVQAVRCLSGARKPEPLPTTINITTTTTRTTSTLSTTTTWDGDGVNQSYQCFTCLSERPWVCGHRHWDQRQPQYATRLIGKRQMPHDKFIFANWLTHQSTGNSEPGRQALPGREEAQWTSCCCSSNVKRKRLLQDASSEPMSSTNSNAAPETDSNLIFKRQSS